MEKFFSDPWTWVGVAGCLIFISCFLFLVKVAVSGPYKTTARENFHRIVELRNINTVLLKKVKALEKTIEGLQREIGSQQAQGYTEEVVRDVQWADENSGIKR